ncbi:MAG: hypothetical protein HC829_03480 [Bacteroidales bacterium]|nr:hypothetical protein [Candidatus Methylacidiphilales bacterium]NJO54011.1 hypothetical protein [Bacteroidales bacterium]
MANGLPDPHLWPLDVADLSSVAELKSHLVRVSNELSALAWLINLASESVCEFMDEVGTPADAADSVFRHAGRVLAQGVLERADFLLKAGGGPLPFEPREQAKARP